MEDQKVKHIIEREDISLVIEEAQEVFKDALTENEHLYGKVQNLIREMISLYAEQAEWQAVHQALHQILNTFKLFQAQLMTLDSELSIAECQVLLQNWRPCQNDIDKLVGLAEEIEYIGRPFLQDGRELRGESWVVEIVSLRLLVEDTLKEEVPDLAYLLDLVKDFEDACERHLMITERHMRIFNQQIRRLSIRWLRGIA